MAHPEEIEAAAQALFDRHVARCFARGLQPHHRRGTQVKDMPPSYRDDYLADAAAALAAAEAIRRQQPPSLLRPATVAEVIDASTPQGAQKIRENADYHRETLKPFA